MAPFTEDAFGAFGLAIHQMVRLEFAHNAMALIVQPTSLAGEVAILEKHHLTKTGGLRASSNFGASAVQTAGL